MSSALALAPSNGIDRIGKYPITREIGTGPEGSVWLASDPFAGREVAIKLLDPLAMSHPELERRFRRALMNEAALAARLSHPHIVALYDAVADEDLCYVVMEYVAGGNLEAYCDARALLPLDQAVEIVFKCALALEHAHQQGVIHRNLKASNILVRRGTDIKVSDFCSGHAERYARVLPKAQALAYSSPEQLQELGLTQQTDIYSLGVVMYRLLTGREPFHGANDAELAEKIIAATPAAPSRHRCELPSALEQVVLRALERDTRRRYATWAEFSGDLTDAYRMLDHAEVENSDTERFNIVRALSFFRDFQDVEIWETLRSANFRRFPAGRIIMREGERGECFYVLTAGEVEVTRSGTPLDILTPGDCFGEMLYFSQSSARRTTTIKTLGPTTVLEIDSMALRLASAPCQVQFNKAFMRILIDRLTWANAKLAAA
ncbi:MAG: protein kinase [Burkholderiales bacterium]|nr:protein kinase [Burkholderiales bacterium]